MASDPRRHQDLQSAKLSTNPTGWEIFERIAKIAVIPLAVAAIPFLSSAISTLADAFVIGPREQRTELLLKIFEKEEDLEVLNRLAFVIEANLLEGDIFWDRERQLNEDHLKELYITNDLNIAAQYQGSGLEAILQEDTLRAREYFREAWGAFNTYGSVEEIAYMLKSKDFTTYEKGCITAHRYTWNTPEFLEKRLHAKYPASCYSKALRVRAEAIEAELKQVREQG